MRLTGVRALVTGATSGIGQAIAEAYGREGASVVVAGRDASRAEAVVRTLEAAGATATAIVADLRTPDGVAALLAAAGEVDVLVNNAGIYPFGATADTNGAAFDEVIQ